MLALKDQQEIALHSLGYLQEPAYQQAIQKLPPEQRAIKEKLLPAFIKLLDDYRNQRFDLVNQLSQTLLKAAPAHPEIFLILGKITLDVIENNAQARLLLEAYTKHSPNDKNGWLLLAECLFRLAHYQEARNMARKARKLDKTDPQIYVLLGKITHNQRDFTAAKDYNAKGLEFAPDNPTLLTNYGAALQFLNEREEADAFYRKQLAKDPLTFHAYDGLAYSSKDLGTETELMGRAEEALQQLKGQEPAGVESLYFCLGKHYQKRKDTAKGWHYLKKFHDIRRAALPYQPADRIAQQFPRLIETCTKEYLHQPDLARATATEDHAPIFIVGMPRSGTTLTEQILHSHSQCVGRGEMRELNAIAHQIPITCRINKPFPECVVELQSDQLQPLAQRYLDALIPDDNAPYYAIDKSPFNFFCLGLIYQLFPNAKIIHCQRNPMDTALSIYENKFSAEHFWMHSPEDIGEYYKHYHQLMDHWHQALPCPIHSIQYEALIDDPENQLRALLAFLELEWEEDCLNFHQNDRVADTVSIWQVKQPLYKSSDGKWKQYESQLQPFINTIGDYANYPR